EVAVVATNVAQKLTKQLGIGNGSVMPTPGRWQTTGVLVNEVLGGLQYASIYGVLVDVLHCFTDALSHFQIAGIDDAMQAAYDFRGFDSFDLLLARPGGHMHLKMPGDLLLVSCSPLSVVVGTFGPGTRRQLKRIDLGKLCLSLLLSAKFQRVNSL